MEERDPAWVRAQVRLYAEQPDDTDWHQSINDMIQVDDEVPDDEIWLKQNGRIVARLTGITDLGEGRFEARIPEHTVGYGLMQRMKPLDGLSVAEPFDAPCLCSEAPPSSEEPPPTALDVAQRLSE